MSKRSQKKTYHLGSELVSIVLSFADRCTLGQMRASGEMDKEVVDRLRDGTATITEALAFGKTIKARKEAQTTNAERRRNIRAKNDTANPAEPLVNSPIESVPAT